MGPECLDETAGSCVGGGTSGSHPRGPEVLRSYWVPAVPVMPGVAGGALASSAPITPDRTVPAPPPID